ncbi:MAG: hypothetical protein AAF141_13295 [Pseudomonadota bacterium]
MDPRLTRQFLLLSISPDDIRATTKTSLKVIFLLCMNLVFFVTMILTVIQKTRGASEADKSLMWKRGKAIFILTPILGAISKPPMFFSSIFLTGSILPGVQYLMSSVYRPTGINHSYLFIAGFQYLNTLLTSLQVALHKS